MCVWASCIFKHLDFNEIMCQGFSKRQKQERCPDCQPLLTLTLQTTNVRRMYVCVYVCGLFAIQCHFLCHLKLIIQKRTLQAFLIHITYELTYILLYLHTYFCTYIYTSLLIHFLSLFSVLMCHSFLIYFLLSCLQI